MWSSCFFRKKQNLEISDVSSLTSQFIESILLTMPVKCIDVKCTQSLSKNVKYHLNVKVTIEVKCHPALKQKQRLHSLSAGKQHFPGIVKNDFSQEL